MFELSKASAFRCSSAYFLIKKWFMRKQYSAAQNVKKVQYWTFDT